jgi:polysaccharide biosynthesis protein PelA
MIMRKTGALLIWLMAALCIGVSSAAPVEAFSIEFKGRSVKRTLLALYDSRVEANPSKTRLHKLAEMPLNHLGYTLDYHDVNQPYPAVVDMGRYRGVVTWFVEDLAQPKTYLVWIDQVIAQGGKLVALGEIAPREADEIIPLVNQVLVRLGMRSNAFFTELTHKAKVTFLDPEMVGFEQKLNKVIPAFPSIEVRSLAARAHVTIEVDTATGLRRTSPVVTSENGGYAAQNFTIDLDTNTDRLRWLLNPFLFFKLALGDERFPIPDVTTVSGRRIYFSHIDGDGWNNLSEVEGYRQSQALSAEVVTREAIEAFPDLPVSVGLIAADVQPLLGGNANGIRFARQLFALPQVEVASHTHTHPYNWQFFESYSRDAEENMIRGYRPPDMPMRERLTAAMTRAAGKTYSNTRYDPYIAGTDDLPRTYLRQPFELEKEVLGALKFSEQFAPAGKRAKLYLWSGDTTPFEGAVKAVRRANARNMNGGDSRLDSEYPSIAYVPALSRQIGSERQIYAVNSNENTYTNDWTGPFGGQMMLEHTLKNTESPRRLKGFNLYYHMYSGEKQASLRAIRHFLNMARQGEVAPIEASHYAAMADDFFGVSIEQVDLFAWSITRRGAVQTMRLDEAKKLSVDFAASIGVIGETRKDDAVYVTLDPMVERVVLALKARAETETGEAPANEPLATLVSSRWRLENMIASDCKQTFRTYGYGPAEMQWQTDKSRGFRVTLKRDAKTLAEEIRWSDATGRLDLKFAVDGIVPADLIIQCHE